ncbi:MAG: hypothetical protein Q7J09_00860 [Methanocalculus sp.]|uniref:hypothetical protein n=1 Tax=Methanocalculus sp. TaxID=2004547 RepID=UPI0027247EF7|nr:hypothetical protein [Methanocalculus sp.]MDO9538543.1 hypothetical protein [Methanocalculus sp.]
MSDEKLLKHIGRVHQVNFQIDNDVQVCYVDLQKKLYKVLEEIGMKGLFGERVRHSSVMSIFKSRVKAR